METVSVTLKEAMSFSTKLPGQPPLKIVKGKPFVTDHPDLVQFFKQSTGLFNVTVTSVGKRNEAEASEPEPAKAQSVPPKGPAVSRQPRHRVDAKPQIGDEDE